MSTLSSISSHTSAASYLFSRLDTSSKGYIDEDDLVSAFSSLSSTDGTNASDIFTQLDGDSDGKVTESEFSSALQQLSETLNSQYDASRMQGAMPPPPPPPTDDEGFTEEELSSQLDEIGSTDSARSTLISSIVENFDTADTNQDGTVSNAEAMAYAQANDITTSASSDSSATSGSGSDNATVADAKVYQQIMEQMRAYGVPAGGNDFASSLRSTISASA